MIHEVYIGSYARPGQSGIQHALVDFDRHSLTVLAQENEIDCPSWLCRSRKGVLFAVEERTPEGRVLAFTEANGAFTCQRSLSSGGADPCHLAMDDREDFLVACNYTSGSVSLYDLDERGLPVRLCCHVQHAGRSVNPTRQAGPHAHFACYHEGSFFVCDLGQDLIVPYWLERAEKRLVQKAEAIPLPAGNGPRHLCFSPNRSERMYCLAELTANLFFFQRQGMGWALRQSLCSLPQGVPQGNGAAAIHISADGRFLFVSNRGADCVTACEIRQDGCLRVIDVCSVGGATPRDFCVFEEGILVACQDSNILCFLDFDPVKGKLTLRPETFSVFKPTCVQKKCF